MIWLKCCSRRFYTNVVTFASHSGEPYLKWDCGAVWSWSTPRRIQYCCLAQYLVENASWPAVFVRIWNKLHVPLKPPFSPLSIQLLFQQEKLYILLNTQDIVLECCSCHGWWMNCCFARCICFIEPIHAWRESARRCGPSLEDKTADISTTDTVSLGAHRTIILQEDWYQSIITYRNAA
jgi:hypothetical protein